MASAFSMDASCMGHAPCIVDAYKVISYAMSFYPYPTMCRTTNNKSINISKALDVSISP
jgi:hypothetical protein